jgi:hypothetical protein
LDGSDRFLEIISGFWKDGRIAIAFLATNNQTIIANQSRCSDRLQMQNILN